MEQDQKDLIAVVFDMNKMQLRAALYQIILGDDVRTALERPRVRSNPKEETRQGALFGSD